MSEKQKLTLSVNREVVDKAKELGINISEITERVLRGYTIEPSEYNDQEVYAQYQNLFQVMLPLMKKFNFSVVVAEYSRFNKQGVPISDNKIYLEPNGAFWASEIQEYTTGIEQIQINWFTESSEILSNFIESLTKAVEKRKESLKELEMAKRIIHAISDTMIDRESK